MLANEDFIEYGGDQTRLRDQRANFLTNMLTKVQNIFVKFSDQLKTFAE